MLAGQSKSPPSSFRVAQRPAVAGKVGQLK